MRLLATENRIIYVNAIGIRKFSWQISQFSLYLNRIVRLFSKNKKGSSDVIVCNPWIIPLIYNGLITKINKRLIQFQFKRLLSKLDFENYILWIGTPSAVFLLDIFKPDLIVYNPVDRYHSFTFVNKPKLMEYEQQITSESDLILCTSEKIKNDLYSYNENCFTLTHGVAFKHFNLAYNSREYPSDIIDIPKPIIGYFGSLADWINDELLIKCAFRYADASIVLIGGISRDMGNLKKLKNVFLLGYKDFNELPIYLNQFSVCLIPFHINQLTEGVDPIKLREYLCLGKPVVSVDLPEVRALKDLVYIGEDENDFILKVGTALKENDPILTKRRIQAAREDDWSIKMEQLSDIIDNVYYGKEKYKNTVSSTKETIIS